MNPPRWDTENAELVRDELMRRVTAERGSARARGAGRRAPGRTAWVTAAVGLVVLLLTAAVVTAVHARSTSGPPAQRGLSEESSALLQLVPQPLGVALHTWSSGDGGAETGSFRFRRSTPVTAGACSGGGAIEVSAAGGATRRLDCSSTAVLQPGWPGGSTSPRTVDGMVQVRVRVVSGAPRYVVRLWSVDPGALTSGLSVGRASAAVPASLRSCTTADLGAGASFARPDAFQRGLVSVVNRSRSDCAVRDWPTLRPLDATSVVIGTAPTVDQQRSLDGAEGDADAAGVFPPARLAAGGRGWFVTDLDTVPDLRQQDRRARSEAAGVPGTSGYVDPADRTVLCGVEAVHALRLTIGEALITIPVAGEGLGACGYSAQGLDVDPVVARRPTR